jgi:hypothetical protein
MGVLQDSSLCASLRPGQNPKRTFGKGRCGVGRPSEGGHTVRQYVIGAGPSLVQLKTTIKENADGGLLVSFVAEWNYARGSLNLFQRVRAHIFIAPMLAVARRA